MQYVTLHHVHRAYFLCEQISPSYTLFSRNGE